MKPTHHKRNAVRDLTMLLIMLLAGWLACLIWLTAEARAASAELPITASICVLPDQDDPRWIHEVMTGCNYACPDAVDQCIAESLEQTTPAAGQDEIDWSLTNGEHFTGDIK